MTGRRPHPDAPAFPDGGPREIGIVRMSALGDVVHVLPVANALKRVYPAARITWIVEPVPSALLRYHPAVDAMILRHRRRGAGAVWPMLRLARSLRRRRFDLLLALQVAAKANYATLLARSPVKLGFDRERSRELHSICTTHRIPARPPAHVQDEYLEFVEHLGIDPHPVEWRIALTEAERARQRRFRRRLARPVCGLVVATSNPRKDWAPDRFARLADALGADFGMQPVLLGGPGAAQRRMADEILARTGCRPVDALGDGVRRLISLVGACDLVVSPDTGPLHIARALDVPVVGLFGYTNPRRYGPHGRFADLVVDGYRRSPDEDCPPTRARRPNGMRRVTVDAALDAVQRARERYLQPRA